jgi:molybdopterin/thiamine biosynthesis adenylyltransferase
MSDTIAADPTTEDHSSYDLYKRQLGFYNPEERKGDSVNIIGLGGIGSFAAFGIGKLGVPNITLVDDDTVELHNIPNQLHSFSSLPLPAYKNQAPQSKVNSMRDTLREYANIEVKAIEGQIGKNSPSSWRPRGIVVSGVDSMRARMDIWANGRIKYNSRVKLYIDARIAGQLLVVYAVRPNELADCKHYEQTLHSDEDSVPASCTERGVIDVGLMAGAILTNMVRHALTDGVTSSVTTINLAQPPVTSGDWVI